MVSIELNFYSKAKIGFQNFWIFLARKLMNAEQPEKLLSERQEQVFAILKDGETLGVAEIDKRLNGSVPQVTIKQSLARLVALRLVERVGQGRGVRYKKL
jgi:predicted HTH transcriptional regulator